MKFAKLYIDHIKEKQPEWSDKFLSYNELKRLIRLIPDGNAEADIMCLLNNEIDKFNDFFIEKEEEYIIRHKELEQKIRKTIDLCKTNGSQPSESDYKDIVDLHGEMVLLINYCNINYTGLAKILEKYDRKTGAIQRLPFLQKILEHPFLSTEIISKLVRECENIIDDVSHAGEAVERAKEEVVLHGR
ncbi:SPX domain-containing protein 3-like [Vicia villosa]|uniref:SPX domain-containing protein 3-like n=1 Tax=Vicia villosa TaxID=3911 RepID=UPI00273A8FC9|nr:SPX domain-containing protein 3-like [Vicia villosa]